MNEETLEPPCKKYKMENLLSEQVEKTLGGSTNSTEDYFSQDIDVADADVRKSVCDDKYSNFVTPEELDKLREFQVLDEVKSNDEDSNDEDSDSSDGKSDKLPEDEIEKMLDEDLPDDFKGVPKPKEKSYITRQKIVLEEKGINHFEALPLDWMIVRHYSGMPVYMHRTTRVCTLSKPYFLGKGNTRRHDIPISAIPCLLYRKALIEEDKQMAIDKQIDEQIRSGTWQQTGDKTQKSEKNVEISYNFNDKENNETIVDKINNDQNNEMNDNINLDINYKIVKEVNCINNNEMTSKIDDDIEMSDVQVKKSKCRFSHLIIRQNSETKNDNEVYKTNAENIMIRYKSNEEQKQTQSEIENAIVNIEERACKTSFVETVNPTVDFNEKSPSEETKSNSDKAVTTIPDNEITEPNSEPSIEEGAYKKSIMDTVDQSEDINEKSPSEGTEAKGDNTVTKETDNETKEPNSDPTIDEIPLSRQPVVLPGGIVMPPPRVENVSTSWKTQHLTHEQVNDYCKKLFKFKTVNIMHFKRWADRRKYTKARKTLQYPTLPEGTKLITIPAQAASGENGGTKAKRDWVMNMNGRSYLSVFHEYVRRALQKQPVYEFKQLENASTPYQATVFIGGMQYGVGHGSSKRSAKSAAARASIHILIPEMRAELSAAPTPHTAAGAEPDFSFFDYVGIEDPRITEFCAATCEPSPHAILRTCLLRNFGAGDRHIHTEMKKLEYQKMELTMKVGKHSATVVCKNKKTAKQRASQAILQALHPHVRSWGSLLRLYGSRSVKSCKEKKIEEQQITLLQDAARQNEPNYAVLEKLRNEMRKLMERDDAVVPIGTLVVKDDLPTHSGSNLNNVDL